MEWLNSLPHTHKIASPVINEKMHDPSIIVQDTAGKDLERPIEVDWGSVTYLQDRSVGIICAGNRKLGTFETCLSEKSKNLAHSMFLYNSGPCTLCSLLNFDKKAAEW